ncbi:hypothetical protein [Phenylobacterium sp.]|uniref:hypothetical protein n=1 Tax=Phenylobacterium sp. TaxID=1871053 RepID=UPI002C330234|nr:hypothetical protein [Phenylobacterium sp.]HVI33938.1 hypothetical protein [Phenylobacterium sp.]
MSPVASPKTPIAAMPNPAPHRRPSPNRQRLIGRTVMWSLAACVVVLKLTLPVF